MNGLVFLTGATGYVGGRLRRRLEEQGRPLRCLARRRVERYELGRLLRLSAEMKLPGRAWLEFEVRPHDGGSTIRQTALFDPVGLAGLAYWYLLYPLHRLVFSAMIDNIARAAVASRRPARTASP